MRISAHHYVGRLLDYFVGDDYIYKVMELETGGTLNEYIADHMNHILENMAKVIAMKLAQGLEYLHECGIVLGRLSLDTILMTDKSDQAFPRIYNLT